jgi:hypothetical protein
MYDDWDVCTFGHILEKPNCRPARATKAQPVMWRHQQNAIGASFLGGYRVLYPFQAALNAYTRDCLHFASGFFSDDLCHARSLARQQRHNLTGMTIADKTVYAIYVRKFTHICS